MTMRPLEGVRFSICRACSQGRQRHGAGGFGGQRHQGRAAETGDARAMGDRDRARESTYFHAFNRNKRSVTADLGSAEGQALVRRLAAEADIVVENFLPGTLERFGLGFDELRAGNPRLVYCAIAGYDSAGAEAGRAGYDLVLQGESGVMATNGEPGRPPLKFGLPVVDLFTGMYAAQAMLAALLKARETGEGSRIDISLADSGLSLTSYYGLEAMLAQAEMPRYGNMHSSIVPYACSRRRMGRRPGGGDHGAISELCIAILERPDLADDPAASNLDRVRNRDALQTAIGAEFRWRSRDWLLQRLAELGLPAGGWREVRGMSSARASEMQVLHEGKGKPAAPGSRPPWRLDGRAAGVAPPLLGELEDVRARCGIEATARAGDAIVIDRLAVINILDGADARRLGGSMSFEWTDPLLLDQQLGRKKSATRRCPRLCAGPARTAGQPRLLDEVSRSRRVPRFGEIGCSASRSRRNMAGSAAAMCIWAGGARDRARGFGLSLDVQRAVVAGDVSDPCVGSATRRSAIICRAGEW